MTTCGWCCLHLLTVCACVHVLVCVCAGAATTPEAISIIVIHHLTLVLFSPLPYTFCPLGSNMSWIFKHVLVVSDQVFQCMWAKNIQEQLYEIYSAFSADGMQNVKHTVHETLCRGCVFMNVPHVNSPA